jgi:chloramphenicol-sensitive protein RarD
VSEVRRGTLYGAGAYLLWGLFPLFWPLLSPSSSLEVLAHRVVWSLLVVLVLVRLTGTADGVRAIVRDPAKLWRLSVAAVVVAVNWGTYIYGVNSGHVLETSLGYYINPLVTVLLGVFVLGERLRRIQWAALATAGLAVVLLTVENGRPPYIALILACSFGAYGLLKKTAAVGAVEGLAVETAVLTPVAGVYLAVLGATGGATFLSHGPDHSALLACSGLVTAVPLLLFGAAARRVPLVTLGVLQYLAPTIQFVLGTAVRHEPVTPATLAGFLLVWAALIAFTWDLLGERRRTSRAAVPELV